MIVKVSERLMILVVAVCDGILTALIAKTHVPTKLEYEGSTLVRVTDVYMLTPPTHHLSLAVQI